MNEITAHFAKLAETFEIIGHASVQTPKGELHVYVTKNIKHGDVTVSQFANGKSAAIPMSADKFRVFCQQAPGVVVHIALN